MATLTELLPFLERGCALRSARRESLRLVGPNRVEYWRAKGYRFEQEFLTLAELKAMPPDVWDWHVVDAAPQQEEQR